MKSLGVFFLVLLCPFLSKAQLNLEQYLSQIQDEQEDQSSLEDQLTQIELLRTEHIPINLWSRQELMATGLFTIYQAHNLVQYRERFGALYSAAELQVIKGFSLEQIQFLKPYLDFSIKSSPLNFRNFWRNPKYLITWRLQADKLLDADFRSEPFRGDPFESRLRLHFKSASGLSFNYNGQKDPGENWAGGFDHHSFNFRYRGKGRIRDIILGDYQLSFGQGLSLWSASNFQGTGIGSNFMQYARGPQAYAGNNENQLFRGLAIRYQLKKLESFLFVSQRNLDAEETEEGLQLRSSGYHRNEKEFQQKDRLRMRSYGLAIGYLGSQIEIKLLHHQHYLHQAASQESTWEQLSPSQSQYQNSSLHLHYLIAGFHLAGEYSLDQELEPAFLLSWEKKWAERFTLQQHWRQHHPKYQTLWSAPAGGNPLGGERGLRTQIQAQWSYKHQSLVRFDAAWFPGPRHLYAGPSAERRVQIIHQWKIKPWQDLQFRLQKDLDMGWKKRQSPQWQWEKRQEYRFRGLWTFKLRSAWRLRSIAQVAWENHIVMRARMMGLQVQYQRKAWTFNSGVGFGAAAEGSPILYDYEPDLLYGFGLQSYAKNEVRLYLRLRWKARAWLLEAKFGLSQLEKQRFRAEALKFQAQFVF